jgi:hypothetical protein
MQAIKFIRHGLFIFICMRDVGGVFFKSNLRRIKPEGRE